MIFKTITVPQYDRLDFTFNPVKEDGTEYTLDDGDKWFFVVKSKPSGEDLKRITQTSNAFVWECVDLSKGVYVYEIGVRFADGTKRTIVPDEMIGETHPKFIVGEALEGKDDED